MNTRQPAALLDVIGFVVAGVAKYGVVGHAVFAAPVHTPSTTGGAVGGGVGGVTFLAQHGG